MRIVIVTPRPVLLLLALAGVIPVVVLAVVFAQELMVVLILIGIPLMVVFVTAVVIALILLVVMIVVMAIVILGDDVRTDAKAAQKSKAEEIGLHTSWTGSRLESYVRGTVQNAAQGVRCKSAVVSAGGESGELI